MPSPSGCCSPRDCERAECALGSACLASRRWAGRRTRWAGLELPPFFSELRALQSMSAGAEGRCTSPPDAGRRGAKTGQVSQSTMLVHEELRLKQSDAKRRCVARSSWPDLVCEQASSTPLPRSSGSAEEYARASPVPRGHKSTKREQGQVEPPILVGCFG